MPILSKKQMNSLLPPTEEEFLKAFKEDAKLENPKTSGKENVETFEVKFLN